jgi:NAD(P)-dependent dehydrogenase (short-subunit alcohol dehydrogenase family)
MKLSLSTKYLSIKLKSKPLSLSFIWPILIVMVFGAILPASAQENNDTPAVLITGTSSGIGLRMTELLSQNGFFIYAGVRTPEDYARLNALDNVQAIQLDVTIQSEIDKAVEFIRSEGKGLYGLINNAGVAVMGPLIELSEEEMDFQLDVNLFGPYRITKAFAELLIESEGRIMNVSSISGILSGQLLGAYSMSKHGVEAYTDALAAELQRFNVKVAAVEPGNYKSQILSTMIKRMKDKGYTAENSKYGSVVEMMESGGTIDRSQYNEPDDVAQAALHFLTSDTPKRRYMVVPNRREAEITIRQMLRELVQLNEKHPFTYSRDELVEMLDQELRNQ